MALALALGVVALALEVVALALALALEVVALLTSLLKSEPKWTSVQTTVCDQTYGVTCTYDTCLRVRHRVWVSQLSPRPVVTCRPRYES